MTNRAHFMANNSTPVTTTGLSTATIAVYDPIADLSADNVGMLVYGRLIGKDSSNNIITLQVQSQFRILSGTLTQRGGTTTIHGPNGDTVLIAVTASFDVNGSNIRLRAGGLALTDISWTGWIDGYTGEF